MSMPLIASESARTFSMSGDDFVGWLDDPSLSWLLHGSFLSCLSCKMDSNLTVNSLQIAENANDSHQIISQLKVHCTTVGYESITLRPWRSFCAAAIARLVVWCFAAYWDDFKIPRISIVNWISMEFFAVHSPGDFLLGLFRNDLLGVLLPPVPVVLGPNAISELL